MAAEEEDAEPEAPSRKGMSLKLKFSLVLVLLLLVMVAGSGWLFFQHGLSQLDKETDKRGATLASTLAGMGADYWNAMYAEGKASAVLQDLVAQKATALEIGDIYLVTSKPEKMASARPSGEVEISGGEVVTYAVDPSISIRRGATLEDKKANRSTAVRVYTMPLRAGTKPASETSAHAVILCLNAQQIDSAREELGERVLVTTGLALALGAAVAWWLGSIVTGPLELLMKDIHAVSRGDLEHRTHAHSADEIGELAETFNQMTVVMRQARESELERRSIEHDLDLARQIQSNLLPKRIPKLKGIDLHPFYRAAKEVGGDYYDLVPISGQHLGIAVGDVSGKGVQGSMVMAMTRAILRSSAPGITSSAKTLIRTNHVLAKDLKPGSFVTLGYGVLDVVGRTFTVSRAGHNPFLIFHAATRQVELLNPGGIALGFDPGPIFERTLKEAVIPLVHGDIIVTYTDGVVESMNEAREQWGMDKFKALIAAHAAQPAVGIMKALVDALDRHQGNAPQHDDITVVILKVL